MYLSIFYINNDPFLKKSLKDDFEQFFSDNNYSNYLEIINTVILRKFDFWTVFEKLDSVVESETLKEFLKKYEPEIVSKELNRRELFLNDFENFFGTSDEIPFLNWIVTSIDQYPEIPKENSFFIHIINSYDRKMDDLETMTQSRFVVDKIVSFVAQKTGEKHEVIALKIGFKNYTNMYRQVLAYCIKLLENNAGFKINKIREKLYSFFTCSGSCCFNPGFRFSDGSFLFETVFALGGRYQDIKACMVEAIVGSKGYYYNSNELSKMVEIIKKIVKSDKDKYDQRVGHSDLLRWSPHSICLPQIVKVTDELKNLVAQDNDLMSDIAIVHKGFERLNSTIASNNEPRNVLHCQAVEFLAGFLKESMAVGDNLSNAPKIEIDIKDETKNDSLETSAEQRLIASEVKNLKENVLGIKFGSQNIESKKFDSEESKPSLSQRVKQQIGQFLKKITTRHVIWAGLLIGGFAFLAWQVQKKLSNFTRIFAGH
jgi:hypothetical protein